MKVARLSALRTARRYPQEISSLKGWVDPKAGNLSDPIWNQNSDLSAFSAVPQPIAPPRTPNGFKRKPVHTKNTQPRVCQISYLMVPNVPKLHPSVKAWHFKDRIYILRLLYDILFVKLYTSTLRWSYFLLLIESACTLADVSIAIDKICCVVDS